MPEMWWCNKRCGGLYEKCGGLIRRCGGLVKSLVVL